MKLIDYRTDNGSRRFACLPRTVALATLRDHFVHLPGIQIINFVSDGTIEPWLEFLYQGHRFSIHQQHLDFWFQVRNPQCGDVVLYQLTLHAETLLLSQG